jgi:transposase InsO family protein
MSEYVRDYHGVAQHLTLELLTDERLDLDTDDPRRPILLAVSDNGPPMKAQATRAFMALMAIAQHHGRPHTPTDQAWIETFFGHIKGEWPHLEDHHQPDPPRNRISKSANRIQFGSFARGDRLRHPRRRTRRPRGGHPAGPP